METDPLIAYGWETAIQVTAIVILGLVIGLMGFFSRKLEGALFVSVLGGGSIIALVVGLFLNTRFHIF